MVRLNKIYTRTGDDGETSLVNGQRVSKHSRRPAAFGEVDELNSVIGLARLHATGDVDAMLARIQNDLFDLGADLAAPETDSDRPVLRISGQQIARLEAEIPVDQLYSARWHRIGGLAASGTHSCQTGRAEDDRTGSRRGCQ